MYARAGDVLYVHGAPASRMLWRARSGAEVCGGPAPIADDQGASVVATPDYALRYTRRGWTDPAG